MNVFPNTSLSRHTQGCGANACAHIRNEAQLKIYFEHLVYVMNEEAWTWIDNDYDYQDER